MIRLTIVTVFVASAVAIMSYMLKRSKTGLPAAPVTKGNVAEDKRSSMMKGKISSLAVNEKQVINRDEGAIDLAVYKGGKVILNHDRNGVKQSSHQAPGKAGIKAVGQYYLSNAKRKGYELKATKTLKDRLTYHLARKERVLVVEVRTYGDDRPIKILMMEHIGEGSG